jgi:hypothetical protein
VRVVAVRAAHLASGIGWCEGFCTCARCSLWQA